MKEFELLRALKEQLCSLQRNISIEAEEVYAIGSQVMFKRSHNGNYYEGRVKRIRVCNGVIDLKVVNETTRKEYWINTCWLHEDYR